MNWMIYPAARAFIKVCAVLFGAGAAAAVLIHLFMPFFLRSPRTAAPFLLLGTGAELLSILSLSFLMFWGARVLLASRGSRITRNLSMLAFLPALYALLIPFAACPSHRNIRKWTGFGRPSSFWRPSLLSFPSLIRRDTKPQAGDYSWPGASQRQAAVAERPVFSCHPVASVPVHRSSLPGSACCMAAVLLSCGLEIMLAAFPLFWRSACLKRSCP